MGHEVLEVREGGRRVLLLTRPPPTQLAGGFSNFKNIKTPCELHFGLDIST